MCHTTSFHITSHELMPRHMMSHSVTACHASSYVLSCHTLFHFISRHILSHCAVSCHFVPAGNEVNKETLLSSEDTDSPRPKTLPESVTSVPSSPGITASTVTASNAHGDSGYKSSTSSSLLTVLMQTTQPVFNGKTNPWEKGHFLTQSTSQ